ncbi:uncharacterized protein NECHADRAFT_85987 [Fusarium vanettenii 77-13-4]|uniref:Uncharacterized protein n=1 Tax=Fusarium vanettenii (strain ATCC MYA-4622 / CBS 123669 / FGSC 9596 / NRRL 45880 / 77-13-4) TaxID=660122 RepID=C7Z212_FUSV7|nr:uncharacterized protein NECHADRAFT_85987 [Fusarium vanettenii 77-13-4]EEU42093.1 predicted protein [Fusarium vanettenii 77-13-4]
MNTTTNTTTLWEVLQELQAEPYGESLATNAFWIFLFLILFNFVWTLWQLDDRAFYKSINSSTHNDPTSETNIESTPWDSMSRKITSRNVQCLAVTFSSFLLLAQLAEGYWVSQLSTGITIQEFTKWSEATSHFEPAVLRYIVNIPAIVLLIIVWTGTLGIGAVILHVQWRYTKEVLMLNIKEQNKGYYQGPQCPTETGNEENDDDVDLKSGLFIADKDAPGNLFGTTYR